MKRITLMVILLVAGALALLLLGLHLSGIASAIAYYASIASAVGSGGIGSVSSDISEAFVDVVLMMFPSFLLWRACARLADGGEPVMARHRRRHGITLIALPLAVVVLASIFDAMLMQALSGLQSESMETSGIPAWLWASFATGLLVQAVFVALNVMQLYSTVVAFRTLMRRAS